QWKADGGRMCPRQKTVHPLPKYVFSAVAVRADGARRSRRFSVARTRGLYGKARSQEIAIVQRPEGRAPSQILVGALNTYLAKGEGRGEGKLREASPAGLDQS